MIAYIYIGDFILGFICILLTLRLEQRWQRSAALDRGSYGFDIGADLGIMSLALSIMGIGLVMVYSASFTKSNQEFNTPYYFLIRQMIFVTIGLGVMWLISHVNYRIWKPSSIVLWFVSWLILMLVFVNGREIKGAKRWLDLGFTNLQPVELVKVTLILAACRIVSDLPAVMPSGFWPQVKKLTPLAMLAILPVGALIFQPDFGSVIIVFTIVVSAYFLVGGRLTAFIYAISGVVLVGFVMVLWLGAEHISKRLGDYWAMRIGEKDPDYNIYQALVSFGSGQVTGQGIGQSSQRNFFLPEAHTDFIFDIYGEETGLFGVLVLIALYTLIFVRGLRIARRAPTPYGGLVASIISLLFFTQALTNMSMAIGLAPAKGLTLPLMSYGGSSLIIVCAMLGILLNISRRPSALAETHPLWKLACRIDITAKHKNQNE